MIDAKLPSLDELEQDGEQRVDLAIRLRQHVEDNPSDLEARAILETYLRWLRERDAVARLVDDPSAKKH